MDPTNGWLGIIEEASAILTGVIFTTMMILGVVRTHYLRKGTDLYSKAMNLWDVASKDFRDRWQPLLDAKHESLRRHYKKILEEVDDDDES